MGIRLDGNTLLFMPYPSTSGTWGSTLNLEAIADRCRRAGARTVFHACEPTAEFLRAAGYPVVPFSGIPPRPGGRPIDSFYDVCSALGFDDRAANERLLVAERAAVAAVRPHALVSDFRLTAPITAAREQLPLASLSAWATDPRAQGRGDDPLDELARDLAQRHAGLSVSTLPELAAWHADARIATTCPSLEPTLSGHAIYTGYIRGGEPSRTRLRLDRPLPQRLVLVYASTAAWGVDSVLRSIGRAAGTLDAVAWCVVRSGGRSGRISDACEAFTHLPFDELLPHARCIVFHGGQGTALASLYHGVPAIVVPGRHYERRYNGERLAELGTGVLGELADLTAGRMARALARTLEDPTMATAVADAQRELRRYPGASAAVEAVASLLGRRVA
jgi:UDP:flavonoid glycosyltransferase YjiC (YdhE family)